MPSALPSVSQHFKPDWPGRTATFIVRTRALLVALAAAAAPIALAFALLPFRANVADATVALGFAVLVSILAAVGTRLTAVIAAVSAALCFDVGFTEPYGSLTISHPQDVETTVLLLIGGLIVGQLSARNRQHRGLAAQTSYDLSRIHAVAEMVAEGGRTDQVVLAVGYELQSLLGVNRCWFETAVPDRTGPSIQRNGDMQWGPNLWDYERLGLPDKPITLIVEHQHQFLGCYLLLADPGTRVTCDQLLAAITLADQAGAALHLDAARSD
jgi:K+-sensing histidine kinase KdpD